MAWRGDGTVERRSERRSGPNIFRDQQVAGDPPTPEAFDATHNDLVDSIENCVAKDGQNSATRDLPMGGHKHTGVGPAERDDQYATLKQLKDRTSIYIPRSGVSVNNNIIILLPDPPVGALIEGQVFIFISRATHLGNIRVNISNLAQIALLSFTGQEILPNTIYLGDIVECFFDGINLRETAHKNGIVQNEVILTQAQYDSIGVKDQRTAYNIRA